MSRLPAGIAEKDGVYTVNVNGTPVYTRSKSRARRLYREAQNKKSPIPAVFGVPGIIVFGIGVYSPNLYLVIVGAVMMIIALIPILAKGTRP